MIKYLLYNLKQLFMAKFKLIIKKITLCVKLLREIKYKCIFITYL